MRQLGKKRVHVPGYRYELYCASKSVKTTQVTVECVVSVDQAWEWNQQRATEEQYSRDAFDALIMRSAPGQPFMGSKKRIRKRYLKIEMCCMFVCELFLKNPEPVPCKNNYSTRMQFQLLMLQWNRNRWHMFVCCRYEAPDSRNRWDSPLIAMQPDDPLPSQALSDALYQRKAPPPNMSTQSVSPNSI